MNWAQIGHKLGPTGLQRSRRARNHGLDGNAEGGNRTPDFRFPKTPTDSGCDAFPVVFGNDSDGLSRHESTGTDGKAHRTGSKLGANCGVE